jgi:hypothetical protein
VLALKDRSMTVGEGGRGVIAPLSVSIGAGVLGVGGNAPGTFETVSRRTKVVFRGVSGVGEGDATPSAEGDTNASVSGEAGGIEAGSSESIVVGSKREPGLLAA